MSARRFAFGAAVAAAGGLLFAAASPASKDSGSRPATLPPQASAGTMGDHMNRPLHRLVMSIFALPVMQSELGLSGQQTATLIRLNRELVERSKDIARQMDGRQKELDQLLSGDTSRTRTVKALFEKIADLRAQLAYATFDTEAKMKAALRADQRSRFEAMKPMDLHRVMMSHGNMADAEALLERLGMEEGMDNRAGMMRDGMHAGMNGAAPQAPAN